MSVVTHSIHVFLPLPFLMPPTAFKFLHLETQSSAFLRSTCPYHLIRPRLTTLSTLSIPKPCLGFSHFSVLQGHSRHPPNHIIFRSEESLHISYLHRPSFATIHEHPLYTRSIYLSFYSQGSFPRCQQHFIVHELSVIIDDIMILYILIGTSCCFCC